MISKKSKKAENFFWRPRPRPQWKNWFFYYFFPWLGSYGVNLMGKAIDLSLKVIKTIEIMKFWNFEILGFGLWVWPSNFFCLWRFFWDLWCLRSPVVCKNYISEQYFMPNSFWCQYSIPVHCEMAKKGQKWL